MRLPIVCFATASFLLAQSQYQVIPAAYTNPDANSYLWVAGASQDVRQQTLIGASHLQPLLGKQLTGLELRRTAANEVYAGGVANLTVSLSISPLTPLQCSDTYAQNVGTAAQVFSGAVTFPTSPANTGPNVAWAPDTTIRIPFAAPFLYTGGTLCIDVLGQKITGQTANWWMADAVFEDIQGTATRIGDGCGYYGGPNHRWSWVETRSLLPGARAHFSAQGTPLGLGAVLFGNAAAVPAPVAAFGVPAPANCFSRLDPASILVGGFLVFVPENDPRLAARGGFADHRFWIPDAPWTFGMTLSTQWVDFTQQFATSDAWTWTVASVLPTLDMAFVDGSPLSASGLATVHIAPVWRFEYQP
jgi:hypothetical protein